MKTVKIDSKTISSWETFHNVFSDKLKFPSYYGRNMDAWVDCMDELHDEMILIDLGDCRDLKERTPEIVEAISECSAFVNYRKIEAGESAIITISMFV